MTSITGNGHSVETSQPGSPGATAQSPPKPSPNGTTPPTGHAAQAVSTAEPPQDRLQFKERLLTALTLLIWLNLFAGGIFIDSQPARCAISRPGAAAMGSPATRNAGGETDPCADYYDAQGNLMSTNPIVVSWFIAVVFFLPLNLALLCATAGVLGTFGNIANLSTDHEKHLQDHTNPYISGLLRGFFVYLFVISGLLVLDDAPFSNSSPGQYIRLAGFLSLLSFIVNYQPDRFGRLLDTALNRIPSSDKAVGVAHPEDDEMAVQGRKVTAKENRDGTMTLHAELGKEDSS